MTSIGLLGYASGYGLPPSILTTPTPANPKQAGGTQAPEPDAASPVTVTLSEAAKAAIKAQADTPSLDSVTAAALKTIGQLLTAAGATGAISGGQATIDLSGLDRRSLFAVADNATGAFTADEQTVAADTLATSFENALAGPVAASRVTGDYASIYKAALAYLDKAGPEEKASPAWTQERAEVANGLQQVNANPGALPDDGTGDPVAAYVKALDGADPTTTRRDILEVAGDVRTALDQQYAAAPASGGATGAIDLSDLDDRSLAAMALNEGDQFSAHEVLAAKTEVRARSASSVLASYGQSGDAGAFSSDLIGRYSSMSDEERQAQGWTPEVFAKLVQNYKLSQTLGSMAGGGAGSLLATPDGASGSGSSSLLDFLT
jgi:hypothetical protein